MRVLALISDNPDPPHSRSRVRNYHIWKELRKLGIEVRILGLGGPAIAKEAQYFSLDRPGGISDGLNLLLRSRHEWPRSTTLLERAKSVLKEWKPDILHAEELRMGGYLAGLPPGPFKKTVTLHDFESELIRKPESPLWFGAPLINWAHRLSLDLFERTVLKSADLAFAYSETDRKKYQNRFPALNWKATRNGVDTQAIHPQPQTREAKILFVGSLSYGPNVRGLFWFLDHVAPRLPAGIRVTIAGSRANEEVRRRLSRAEVTFVDTPADLGPIYRDHALTIVPLFEGSGTRGKILESLAHERAVVTTATGVEGLELKDGEGFVQAESAELFAAEIERLVADFKERAAIARAGRKLIESSYDWSCVARDLGEEWSRLLAERV